ncbi:MAG TPA: nucleotidyltransferase family protein [Chloroflexota bacterium]|nr:nucleotidyltransferase family protein [Chloroflexota bacterium]
MVEDTGVTTQAVTLEELRARRDEILHLAASRGASNVRVFGSVARGEAHANSDIDLLVEFEPGRSLIDLTGLMLQLEDLLGRKVDIGTQVHSVIRDRVERDAVAL